MAEFTLKNLSIRLRITILSVVVLFYGLSLVLFFGSFQQKISEKRTFLTKTYFYKNNILNNSQRIINSFIVFNHISFEKLDDFVDIQNSFFLTNDSISQLTKKYQKHTTTIDENIIIDNFLLEYQMFQNIIYEIFHEYKKDEISLNSIGRLFDKELSSYQSLTKILKELKYSNNKNFSDKIAGIEKDISNLIIRTIISFLIFVILFVLLTIIFFRDSLRLPVLLEPYLKKLSEGETIQTETQKKSQSKLISSVNQISNNYNKINDYINKLKNKEYDFELEKISKNDIISTSIVELKKQLISSQKDIELREKQDKQKEWSNYGVNKFSELMRKYSNNLEVLSDIIIKEIVKYLGALVGGLFIVRDSEDEKEYLELIAAFAYDRKKYYSKKIQFGEGLIGTVAVDKTTIHLNHIPDDYLEIESGLGNSSPNNLLILPLLTDTGLLGIIEIASLTEFEEYKIEFSEAISRSIAATIESVKVNARTIDLLTESQKKSDELASREKILQETMDEVSNAHQVAKRNEIEMTGILTGVDQTLMRAEYSVDGRFINSNIVHRQTMGYDIDAMKGKNILEFIQEEEKDDFKKMWSEVARGRPKQITVKRQNKQTGADIWLLNQYTPIKGDKGSVIKILYLAIDITEQKQAEQMAGDLLVESQEKEIELKSVLAGIDRTILRAEYTSDGDFIDSNEVHRRVIGYELKDMIGKNILAFIQEDQKTEFNRLWREVVAGRPKELTVKRINKNTGKNIWLINQYNPILDENGNVNKVLYLAIDITEQKKSEEKIEKVLRDTQEKEIELRGIFSGIDQAIMRAEYLVDGTFVSANDIHEQTMGYKMENMKGKNILEFVADEDKSDFQKTWESVKKGNLEQVTVQRVNKLTNEKVWLLNQYTPIEDLEGNVVKILYLAIDITEQKNAENRANILLLDTRKKELELQNILKGVDRTILRAEYTTGGKFIDSNNVHQNVMGYKLENMIGKSILDFIPQDEINSFNALWQDVVAGNAKEMTVKRENKKTGDDIWLINQYNPIFDENNKVYKILYLAIDITKQKEIETNAQNLLYETQSKDIEMLGILSAVDQTLMRAEYSVEGDFIAANEIHINTLGYDYNNMIGKNILEFIIEEEKEEFGF